jgi:hypothetical protein
MRLSGLRSLCLLIASISAAAMFEPEHCMMKGMPWSVALLSAISASAGLRLVVERHQLELRRGRRRSS